MKSKVFILFLLILPMLTLAQLNFQNTLNELLTQPEYKHSIVGIQIEDISSGEVLFELNSEKLMIPASTMKLVTTAAALEILGADYRFVTKIGFSGKVTEKKLDGDLIVVGGGDPALGSEYFRNEYENPHFLNVWAQKLKAAGISQVDGNLILDGSLYDSENIPPTWVWEDMGNYYGAGASALTVYDNLFRITFSSPEKAEELTQIISTYPKMEGIEFINNVLSSDINSDQAYVFGSPLDSKREIRGTIPKNQSSFSIKAAVHHPEELLAKDFISHLAKAGIFIKGEIKFEKVDPEKFQAVYLQESPTLTEIIKVLNHESVNLFAEHLVKQIAVEKTGVGSREKGIGIIQEFWKSKGVEMPFFMEDGSGLSHFNAISPAQFILLLKYMFNESKNKEQFYASLPGIGDGTLSGFSKENFRNNVLKAKSGSMTRVRCYAGYLTSDSGKTLAFSFMFNQFDGTHSKLNSWIEKLWEEIKISY